ncbi:MAG: OmpH family outer membrane protein [Lutibacter sp.]|uniref:OmpH family outer membrane protein n=1 Tax=Lutibacter sp. TaxID=1925666 RepID=UPI00299F46E7|nr:OmpH family outer membrane protein [Lutibacter sp.]MDX1828697.1 OmpH family outer membrane protein [Lutibacter sp.]
MIKKVLLILVLIFSLHTYAQKPQRIGFIDMEYILENIPEYTEAQAKINAKAITWQNKIEKQQKEIDDLKADLNNEKELLTKELIADKEEDIEIKELDLKKLQAAYFGTKGDLYFLRQQLVKPIQDLVYNAIQDIATKRRYDFILDNSSDLVMLYSNKKYNISDLVIKSITRSKKVIEANNRQTKKGKKTVAPAAEISEEAQNKIDSKAQKKAALLKKIEERKAAQLKKREDLKKAIEAKRQARIKQIEDAKKAKEQKKENN